MSLLQIILSGRFIIAVIVYGLATLLFFPLSVCISNKLNNPIPLWIWDRIAIPLMQVLLLILFICLSYPLIFGIQHAPSLVTLLHGGELRMNNLVNILFLITLFFPLIPVVGKWHELVLPLQGIAAVMMIFGWMTHELGIQHISYWPGIYNIILILMVAILTYWVTVKLAAVAGHRLDKRFNVVQSGALISNSLILFMQSPAILIYSASLGRQIG